MFTNVTSQNRLSYLLQQLLFIGIYFKQGTKLQLEVPIPLYFVVIYYEMLVTILISRTQNPFMERNVPKVFVLHMFLMVVDAQK